MQYIFKTYKIELDEIWNSWKIFYHDKQVGDFEFKEDAEGKIWVWNLSLDEPHQRKGLGTYVISIAVEYYGAVYFYVGNRVDLYQYSEWSDYDSRYLSEEGAALLNSCLKNGVIKKEWALNPYVKNEH